MLTLRPYQREAIDATYAYYRQGGTSPVILQIPTGGGKSLIMAMMIRELVEDYGCRVLVMTHVKELIQQNFDEFVNIKPLANVGIYSASLKSRELHNKIVFAGIQSIDKHVHRMTAPDFVFIDECHLISPDDNTRYQKTIAMLKMMKPDVKVIGLTATPYRMDTGLIHKYDNSLFKEIVYVAEVQRLIDEGYLSQIHTKAGSIHFDVSGIHKRGGEFVESELSERATSGDFTKKAIEDAISKSQGRNKWLVFAVSVAHANQVHDELKSHGIESGIVTGDTPKEERDELIKKHKTGEIKALVNVNILTTGYNNPGIDLIILLRPTESASLYVQMIGRGMRKAEGKTDCLVLDYADVVVTHGPIDAINPATKNKGEDGIAPAKECPECHSIVPAGVKHCPYCKYEFPPPALKIHTVAKEAPLLKAQIEPEVFNVYKTEYHIHRKEGKSNSVCVHYHYNSFKPAIREWIFPEFTNERAGFFFYQWCKNAGIVDPPTSAGRFCEVVNVQAKKIKVIKDGDYYKVQARIFYDDEIPF